MQKIKIALELVLPGVPDEKDACIRRLVTALQERKGLEKVHLAKGGDKEPAQLCFHFDPLVISLEQIRGIALKEGAAITQRYGHLLTEVQRIREINEATALENLLRKHPGVLDISVSATGNARIEYDKTLTDAGRILQAIQQSGFPLLSTKGKDHGHEGHDHKDGHQHGAAAGERAAWKIYAPTAVSLLMLLLGVAADNFIHPGFFKGWTRPLWYGLAYLPVGLPVAWQGVRLIVKGDVFTEFLLMTLATVGAFFIGEYPEGVAVMLFYAIGELFQDAAVNRAKRSIKALLDIRPASAWVQRNGSFEEVPPDNVLVGDIVQIRAGDKVPLDGEMLSPGSVFNTAALTGESKPASISKGETVLAGMINQDKVVELRVTKLYNDSSLARILSMVQEATTRKARTEQFIRRFSRIYTPVVVFLAIGIVLLPYFFVQPYNVNQWLYRALIFLVISCPCALVISIPLGYFGGIGAASRHGILFKGSNYLDLMQKVNMVIMDKTGTLTKGVFKVQEVKSLVLPEADWLPLVAALEAASTHPVARAVVAYAGDAARELRVEGLEEIGGHGIKGLIGSRTVLAGNLKLMDKMGIGDTDALRDISDTIVIAAVDGRLAGYLTIADEIKEDSLQAIAELQREGIATMMLSGDKQSVVDKVARALHIDKAFGDLLPDGKVQKVTEQQQDKSKVIAFVGDGINDAPVLALSDVGMAMGGLGSDAAIETADVIIQTDQPSRIPKAIRIGKATNRVVWQNIILAFLVKGIVLILGAGGLATMWEAVFADVGVALLAIFNAMRIQRIRF
ncbi:heavy metal translocating P-type ATPase [Taibaiella helva]|uniref:heavy metal translocating P-type ATPase n=1 Tax=Taibaiella helva TaxID=2301235 RepID=UPI000E576C91|nr:heavy metal translocating P-type ATPase [Taibaiella helva]